MKFLFSYTNSWPEKLQKNLIQLFIKDWIKPDWPDIQLVSLDWLNIWAIKIKICAGISTCYKWWKKPIGSQTHYYAIRFSEEVR